ncbi:MAG: 3'-5' exonuclease, partial [Halobacteriaceae archaeon]
GGASGRGPSLREFVDACALEEGNGGDGCGEEEADGEETNEGEKERGEKESEGAVVLTTLHASKGLEFPVVFMVGACEDVLPHWASLGREASVAEERRLCYVGFTRARDRLIVTHPLERPAFGNILPCRPSRFLEEAALVPS